MPDMALMVQFAGSISKTNNKCPVYIEMECNLSHVHELQLRQKGIVCTTGKKELLKICMW